MGQTYPSRSLASLLAGAAVVATVQGCGGASATFPEKDASTSDVSIVGSNSSSGGFGDETGATSSSGGGNSGGTLDDAATSSSDSGNSSVNEAGDASAMMTGADSGDTKDAPAPTESGTSGCAAICEGCCDSNGKCVTGGTVAVCGKSGASCEDCSKNSCIVSSAPCCTTAGKCGCAVAGFVACE